jgi:hypothetical protein
VIGELLAAYDHLVGERSTNNDLSTRFFIQRVTQFRLNNERRQLAEVAIYPKEYLDFPVLWRPGEYSMHLFMGSWRLQDLNEGLKARLKRSLGRRGIGYTVSSPTGVVQQSEFRLRRSWL